MLHLDYDVQTNHVVTDNDIAKSGRNKEEETSLVENDVREVAEASLPPHNRETG